jgi:hypothetical protein
VRQFSANWYSLGLVPALRQGPTRGVPALPGSAAIYTEGTASRPPTAQGLADIRVQENEVCTFGVTHGPHYGTAVFPAVRVLAAPQIK